MVSPAAARAASLSSSLIFTLVGDAGDRDHLFVAADVEDLDATRRLRERKLIWSTGTRIDWPVEVASMIWSDSSTGKEAMMRPPRGPGEMALTPMPPRPRTG